MTKATRIACLSALSLSSAAGADIWIEPRDSDAGAFVNSAQIPVGVGTLDGIQGALDGAESGLPDFHDLFQVHITDPLNFSATTVSLGGGADVDTNLWLFDPGSQGRLGNRSLGPGSTFSRLTPIADDGSFALTIPGIYYIGVSGGDNNRPTSGGQQIFNFLTTTELSGPDGPGGGGVHNGWSGPSETGLYLILLTGVSYVPSPGVGTVVALALTMASRRRRP